MRYCACVGFVENDHGRVVLSRCGGIRDKRMGFCGVSVSGMVLVVLFMEVEVLVVGRVRDGVCCYVDE